MNNIWRKVVTLILAGALALLLTEGAVFAAPASPKPDVIGVIDSQEIVSKHPSFEDTAKKLQQMVRQKENEARTAIEKETDPAKQNQIMQGKRLEASREEQSMMEPIYNDCQTAVRVVAQKRGVTVVLEKSSVYYGGQDITQFVIQQLNLK